MGDAGVWLMDGVTLKQAVNMYGGVPPRLSGGKWKS
jgi:hypothetical protein